METKKCNICKIEKSLKDFCKDSHQKDGLCTQCRECRKNKRRKKIEDISDGYKTCDVCNVRKLFNHFHKCKECRGGVRNKCIDCVKEWGSNYRSKPEVKEKIKKYREAHKEETKDYLKQYYQDNKDSYKNRKKILPKSGKKICCTCKKKKDITKFSGKSTTKDGLMRRCKKCVSEYYTDNKAKIAKKAKQHYLKNKKRINTYKNNWYKKRVKEDIVFRISKNLRSSVKYRFKDREKQIGVLDTTLCCTMEEFKKHIESQFLDWMNWDNYGKYNGEYNYGWDLDHIIPLSLAETEEELYLLSHWSNFQPLCSKVNRYEKRDELLEVTNIELEDINNISSFNLR